MRGATPLITRHVCPGMSFNPPPPMRGATVSAACSRLRFCSFQPAPPMRGATATFRAVCALLYVSTRAPHAGSDSGERVDVTHELVSTRAPHAGSDVDDGAGAGALASFNPRPPCGERRKLLSNDRVLFEFQPAPPMRGATQAKGLFCKYIDVSTRAPHAGSD